MTFFLFILILLFDLKCQKRGFLSQNGIKMLTKWQHAGIIRHLTNQTIARNNGSQKNTASNYKCKTGLNAAKSEVKIHFDRNSIVGLSSEVYPPSVKFHAISLV